MGRGRTIWAALGVVVVALAGCAAGSEAAPSGSAVAPAARSAPVESEAPPAAVTTTSAVPTSAAPPSAAALPAPPDAASERTGTGAGAMAEFAVEQLETVFRTGDGGPLLAVSTPDCDWCAGRVQAALDLRAGGELGEWEGLSFRGETVGETSDPAVLAIDGTYVSAPMTVTAQVDGVTRIRQSEGSAMALRFWLRWEDGVGWRVLDATKP